MRQCEKCGSRMPPFVPRKTIDGRKVCEGCQQWASRTSRKTAVLHNPTGELRGQHPDEWYHGTKHDFEDFADPGSTHPLAYVDDPEDTTHWNTILGNHFTAQHEIAERFASGSHKPQDDYFDEGDDEASEGHIVHAKLHIRKPKTYRSEFDMDQEVYEHERAQGNHIDRHLEQNKADNDDGEGWYDAEEFMPHAVKYKGDSQKHFTKNDADKGTYGWSHEFRPAATGWLNAHPDKHGIAMRFKKRLQDQGYDGVVYGNDFEQNLYDKGRKHLDFHRHEPLDTPEVSDHNMKVPQHSISAIAFEPHQIEVTQHHYGNECKTPQEAETPSGRNADERMPPAHTPYRQSRLPETDVDRTPGSPKYLPARHVPAEHEPLTSYSSHRTASTGPFFHGTSHAFEPGDLVDPSRELGGRRGAGQVFMTTDPEAAHNYGRYKAQAQWAIGDDAAEPHAYEVEPTGPVEVDDTVDERFGAWRSRHPLRIVRKIGRTASHGEQSALNHAGAQDVYPVSTNNGIKHLCEYHRGVHEDVQGAANDLARDLDLTPDSPVRSGLSQKGRCAACSQDPGYQLKLQRPPGFDDMQRKDSRLPRRRGEPYVPARTAPLPTLRQSLNAADKTWYHADRGRVRLKDGGYWGDHHVPAGAELHHDVNDAWHHAIEHWDSGHADFPRVYKVHEGDVEDHGDGRGTLRANAEASEVEHDHEKHPALRGQYDDDDAPVMFHGTTKASEDDDDPHEITPSGGGQTFGPGVADPSYAYATPKHADAWRYAEKRSENVGGQPRVYRVTPKKPEDVEVDPSYAGDYSRGNYQHDKRSKSGFDVLDEVPMSQKQQYSWNHSPFNDEAEDEDDWDEDDDSDWGDSHYGVKLANEQMSLFHAEPTGPQRSPKAEWHQRMIDKHTQPEIDPDDVEHDCEECWENHSRNQGHRECRSCGERHADHETTEDHETGYTDWDMHYPRLNDEIHRGMPIKLPADDRLMMHGLGNKGTSLSHAEQAATLMKHVTGRELGMHWTDHRPAADDFTTRTANDGDTEIVVHAKKPERHHIETDWENLRRGEVYGYDDHEEAEVPLKGGAPVHITGISWRPKAFGPGSHGTYPVNDWIRHDFDQPVHHTATKGATMKQLPTLRMMAHDATENQALRHCPMCGSGKIIGRQDGSVECEYCHTYFTVQIQPQFPNFPQTIDGVPQQIPGMPGQVETPVMEGGVPMPGEDPVGEDGNPFADGGDEGDVPPEEDDGASEPPPFAKKSFRTATGAVLHEDDYLRHLMIRHAPDREAVLAQIRQERG